MTKERKTEIKSKVLKVINIIGYISIALVMFIGLICGVHSCKNESTTNQMETSNVRLRLKTLDNDNDYLFGYQHFFGDNYHIQFYNFEININDNTTYKGFKDMLCEISNYDYNVGKWKIAIQYRDSNNQELQYQYINAVSKVEYITDETLIFYYQNNSGSYILNDTLTSLSSIRFMVIPQQDLLYPDTFFKYCKNTSIYQNGAYLSYSLIYEMPIYLTIEKSERPFQYNMSFNLQRNKERRYYQIDYNNNKLNFKYYDLSNQTENVISLTPTISKNGKQYIFKLSDLYGIDLANNKTELYKRLEFEFFAFSVNSYEFVSNNFIFKDEPIISGSMYFSPNMAYDYLNEYRNTSENEINVNTIEGFFVIGGAYYTSISATLESLPNSNSYQFRLTARNGNNETITIFRGYKSTDYGWASDNLIQNTSLYYIEYDDIYYTESVAWSFQNYLFLEDYTHGVIGNGDNTYIGDTFVLIGSGFSAITSILGISILPNITIGMLLFVPLIITIVLFVVWLFKR